jgi:hypothetical protein
LLHPVQVVMLDGPADRAAAVPASVGEYLDDDALAKVASHRDAALPAAAPS